MGGRSGSSFCRGTGQKPYTSTSARCVISRREVKGRGHARRWAGTAGDVTTDLPPGMVVPSNPPRRPTAGCHHLCMVDLHATLILPRLLAACTRGDVAAVTASGSAQRRWRRHRLQPAQASATQACILPTPWLPHPSAAPLTGGRQINQAVGGTARGQAGAERHGGRHHHTRTKQAGGQHLEAAAQSLGEEGKLRLEVLSAGVRCADASSHEQASFPALAVVSLPLVLPPAPAAMSLALLRGSRVARPLVGRALAAQTTTELQQGLGRCEGEERAGRLGVPCGRWLASSGVDRNRRRGSPLAGVHPPCRRRR